MKIKTLALAVLSFFVLAGTASATSIVVNTAADNLIAGDKKCTLREAIRNASFNADFTQKDCKPGEVGRAFPLPNGKDQIHFKIPPGQSTVIKPTTPLVVTNDWVDIRADVPPGSAPGAPIPSACYDIGHYTPSITLDGSLLNPGDDILRTNFLPPVYQKNSYKIAYQISGLRFIKSPGAGLKMSAGERYSHIACNHFMNNHTGILLAGNLNTWHRSQQYAIHRNKINFNQIGIDFENSGLSYVQRNWIGFDLDSKGKMILAPNGVGIDFTLKKNPLQPKAEPGSNGVTYIHDNNFAAVFSCVVLRSGHLVHITENQMECGQLGIDLVRRFPVPEPEGITLNDDGDVDGWGDFSSNEGQNYPVLKSAALNPAGTMLTINCDTDFDDNYTTQFRIDFFANPQPLAPGQRIGKTWLGFVNVISSGPTNHTIDLPVGSNILPNQLGNMTATASAINIAFVPKYQNMPYLTVPPPDTYDTGYTPITGEAIPNQGSTSEFSAPVTIIKKGPGGETPPVPWNPVPTPPGHQTPHGGENPPHEGGGSGGGLPTNPTNPTGPSGTGPVK